MRGHPAEEPGNTTTLSRCLSATGIRLLGILSRPGIPPLLRSAYHAKISADPDRVSVFRTHETRLGWAPSIPRGQRCSHDRYEVHGRRLPLLNGQPLSPRSYCPPRGARINGTSSRVHWCSPVQPSPHLRPRDGTGALGLSPEAPHPCGQDPQAHVQGGDRSRTLTRSHVPGITGPPPTDLLTTCDLTSQPRLRLSRSRPPRLGRPAGVAARSATPNLDPVTTRKGIRAYEEDGGSVEGGEQHAANSSTRATSVIATAPDSGRARNGVRQFTGRFGCVRRAGVESRAY
jgi:hypothetical protein